MYGWLALSRWRIALAAAFVAYPGHNHRAAIHLVADAKATREDQICRHHRGIRTICAYMLALLFNHIIANRRFALSSEIGRVENEITVASWINHLR